MDPILGRLRLGRRRHTALIPAQNLFNADFDPQALQAALAWLYPGGYSPDHAAKNVVLATTNALVDEWNEIIASASANLSVMKTYVSVIEISVLYQRLLVLYGSSSNKISTYLL